MARADRTIIAWRRAVQAYGCTRCGAPPGMPCHTDTGRLRYEPHVDRSRLASEAGWEPPEEAEVTS